VYRVLALSIIQFLGKSVVFETIACVGDQVSFHERHQCFV